VPGIAFGDVSGLDSRGEMGLFGAGEGGVDDLLSSVDGGDVVHGLVKKFMPFF
jgi:hypothetical protein